LMAAAAARCLLSLGSPALRRVPARRLAVAGGALLLLLLLGAPRAGIYSVLNQQDPEAVAAATLIMQTLSGNDRLVAHLPPEDSLAKYSAVAHLVARDGGSAARYTLQAGGESGSPPGLLLVGRAGRYALYRSAQ
ncbi:MAG: hypothetical protein M3380_21575, partial [Chloroflexota bacterium]|nr:hypothetical protein [Chloroflexota bacterium]